jgi:hypothetical protein
MVMLINNSKELTHLIEPYQFLIPAMTPINFDSGKNPIKDTKIEVGDFSNFYDKFKAPATINFPNCDLFLLLVNG